MRADGFLPLAGALCAAALGLAACGQATVDTGSLQGDAKSVAQTISDLQKDAQSRDQNKVCKNDLASSVVANLARNGGSCPSALSGQLKEIDNFDLALASAKAVQVNGTTATAKVKSTSAGKTRYDTLTLVKEGNRWKVSGLQ